MSRLVRLLEQWLPLWACLSGAMVPVSQAIGAGTRPETKAAPTLGAQLADIVDFVALQEHDWRFA